MGSSQTPRKCAFFQEPSESEKDSLAILYLKRDSQLSLLLRDQDDDDQGYAEGKVTNTRYGSFPHSTLIGVPWGSQVAASAVDTGSRGRRAGNAERKRKRKRTDTPDGATENGESARPKEAVAASSGFGHLLPPTPERWTYSLPHRTQIVYTPDYSYILQRIRARPGSVLIEAGAGSGSFSHASARAVFNGQLPNSDLGSVRGHVWSFEAHAKRAEELKAEIRSHDLESTVTVTHRDVYKDGFAVVSPSSESSQLVRANSIFLDLPAPWLALPHLTRAGPDSPLDPDSSVYICTFSPCIEQVQATVTALRAHGWLDVSMVELSAKRLETRRERVGLHEEGLRGVAATAASVDEALDRLRMLEERSRSYQTETESELITKRERLQTIKDELDNRKLYKEGRLVHRSEPELKTHTSYLVFAVLPREWSEEHEEKAAAAALLLRAKQKGKSWKQVKRERKAAIADEENEGQDQDIEQS